MKMCLRKTNRQPPKNPNNFHLKLATSLLDNTSNFSSINNSKKQDNYTKIHEVKSYNTKTNTNNTSKSNIFIQISQSKKNTNEYQIGNYLIKKVIGKGTFGKVNLATCIKNNEKVAIKIIDKSKILEKDDLIRLEREFNMLKSFNNLNIITIAEIFETHNSYYTVMEYCEGGELFNYIVSKQRLSNDESAFFYYQLINGLEYLHSLGIVHRDLKPENLLLTKEHILKIIDFGLSNYFSKFSQKLLVTPCGSPCYASPEMVSGKKYNGFKSDIWATGIILFAMLCGFLPFEDNDNNILFRKIINCKLDYPRFLSKEAIDLLQKILVVDPSERITINQIKEHSFYLKGKKIFKMSFNSENNISDDNILENDKENNIMLASYFNDDNDKFNEKFIFKEKRKKIQDKKNKKNRDESGLFNSTKNNNTHVLNKNINILKYKRKSNRSLNRINEQNILDLFLKSSKIFSKNNNINKFPSSKNNNNHIINNTNITSIIDYDSILKNTKKVLNYKSSNNLSSYKNKKGNSIINNSTNNNYQSIPHDLTSIKTDIFGYKHKDNKHKSIKTNYFDFIKNEKTNGCISFLKKHLCTENCLSDSSLKVKTIKSNKDIKKMKKKSLPINRKMKIDIGMITENINNMLTEPTTGKRTSNLKNNRKNPLSKITSLEKIKKRMNFMNKKNKSSFFNKKPNKLISNSIKSNSRKNEKFFYTIRNTVNNYNIITNNSLLIIPDVKLKENKIFFKKTNKNKNKEEINNDLISANNNKELTKTNESIFMQKKKIINRLSKKKTFSKCYNKCNSLVNGTFLGNITGFNIKNNIKKTGSKIFYRAKKENSNKRKNYSSSDLQKDKECHSLKKLIKIGKNLKRAFVKNNKNNY